MKYTLDNIIRKKFDLPYSEVQIMLRDFLEKFGEVYK